MKAKFIFLTLSLLVLSSCSTSIKYCETVGYIDYSQYASKGVFITESNSVNFEYEPLGSISVLVEDGYKKGTRRSKYNYVDLDGNRHLTEEYEYWAKASYNSALDVAVDSIISKGGNGIINLKINHTVQPINTKEQYRNIIFLSGMVIKKK